MQAQMTSRLFIRIPAGEKSKLAEVARARRLSISALIRDAALRSIETGAQ